MKTKKMTDFLSREELRILALKSDFRGLWSLVVNFSLIAFACALVVYAPHPFQPATILLALIIFGNRQLGLAILMHDCAHAALFKSEKLNQWVGQWCCGATIWADLNGYRHYHLTHHRTSGSDADPDRSNYIRYPVTPRSFMRKVARDLSGITGVKTLIIIWKMNCGLIAYQLSYEQKKMPDAPTSNWASIRTGLTRLRIPLTVNSLLLLSTIALGHPELYLLWFLAYLTTYMLFSRIRNAAEHALCPGLYDPDPYLHTRTTKASYWARMTLAPNYVNYHLEHHLIPGVPPYHLPRFHKLLYERGALIEADIAQNYWEVIKKLMGR